MDRQRDAETLSPSALTALKRRPRIDLEVDAVKVQICTYLGTGSTVPCGGTAVHDYLSKHTVLLSIPSSH